jgi:hypothetical protein
MNLNQWNQMTNIPAWVITLVGALGTAIGYLSEPSNLALLPASWATTIATLGVLVGVAGHVLAQYNGHQAIVASTAATQVATTLAKPATPPKS